MNATKRTLVGELDGGSITLESIPLPALMVDCGDLRILNANRGAARVYGYTVAELCSMTLADLTPDDEIQHLRLSIGPGGRGSDFRGPFRHRTKSGRVIEVDAAAAVSPRSRRSALLLVRPSESSAVAPIMAMQTLGRELNHVPLLLWTTDSRLRLATQLSALAAGFEQCERGAVGMPIAQLLRQFDGGREALEAHHRALAGEPAEYEIAYGDQHYRCFVEALRDPQDQIVGVIGLGFEISESVRLRRALGAAESTLRLAQQAARLGTFELERASGALTWSDELYHIFGFPAHTKLSREMVRERIHPDDREVMQSAINDVIERGGALQMECRIVREDGAERWIETYAQPAFDENGDIVHLFGTVSDISPRKEVEAQLAFLAQHDALTGLPNRTLLAERLAESIAAARRTGRNVAVVFLDLDDFKYINDTHGQAVGDRVIRACADRLLACTRPGDTVGRVGGDEFVVVLSDMDASSGAVHAVRRMRAALAEPFDLGDIELGLRASFGISCFPSDGDSPDQLIGFADMAMYRAKQSRRGDFVYFEQSLQDAATERLRLEHELHDAIRDGELVVYYQPVIDARSKRVSGVEALVRWPQQAAALKPPASFIPLAEETGLIVPLGEFVLREACRTVAELHRSGFPELRLAVNLSPRQLDDEALLETVRSALEATGMSPRLLDLEITESFLARDPMRAAMLLDELAALGIRIALDDFGTGYSALTFLRTFPVNVLKLDRSFVTEIEDDPTARAIASTIVALARTLKMHSLAEGVETYEQSRILAEMGCEAFQGYYFARAMPAAALRPFLGGEAARIAV